MAVGPPAHGCGASEKTAPSVLIEGLWKPRSNNSGVRWWLAEICDRPVRDRLQSRAPLATRDGTVRVWRGPKAGHNHATTHNTSNSAIQMRPNESSARNRLQA